MSGKHAYRGSSEERGYGWRHRRLRQRFARPVAAGLATCWRCKRRILPGEAWHLGHDDYDRTKWKGPEHVRCNCSAAARLLHGSGPSREWVQ